MHTHAAIENKSTEGNTIKSESVTEMTLGVITVQENWEVFNN